MLRFDAVACAAPNDTCRTSSREMPMSPFALSFHEQFGTSEHAAALETDIACDSRSKQGIRRYSDSVSYRENATSIVNEIFTLVQKNVVEQSNGSREDSISSQCTEGSTTLDENTINSMKDTVLLMLTTDACVEDDVTSSLFLAKICQERRFSGIDLSHPRHGRRDSHLSSESAVSHCCDAPPALDSSSPRRQHGDRHKSRRASLQNPLPSILSTVTQSAPSNTYSDVQVSPCCV